MDPNNAVVKFCAEGMRAEAERRPEDARALFMQAWTARTNDYEACVAAHFMARQQDDPNESLRWNQQALACAESVGDDRVREFYPSLYLNLGFSHEVLGNRAEAMQYYALAAARLVDLPESPYSEVVRSAVAAGRRRIGAGEAC